MQPNELTLEAQMFDAKINSMDKTCLLAPLSFFDACNVSTDEERLRRMMLLRTRALQLGISEQEYADRRDNYTSQFDADPSYCLKIARMALRRQAMQELGFTPMADVETRQAEYLIEPYLPLDAITILAGVAGMGKTWLALKWAADISTGRATKDGTPGLVYYFTQENDPHIVLSPRLESLGADPENIVIMQQMADTPALTMCDARLDALASRPGCRPSLVVFDPIQSYLEKHANMNQAADVRPMMDHLANFAARYHCAVMLVSHISKPNLSGGSASDRILGSSDFRNAARSIIFVGCDPDDRSLRVFAQDKSSLGPPGPSRKFSIHDGGVEIMDECALTADEILRGSVPGNPRGPEPLVANRAKALLGEITRNAGWEKAKKIYADADKEGISYSSMRRSLRSSSFEEYTCNRGKKGAYTIWYDTEKFPDGFPVQLALEDARVIKT